MSKAVVMMIVLVATVAWAGCMSSDDAFEDDLDSVEQALDAPRTRVVQEASLAMTGSYTTYTTANWPTADTLASYYYTLTDTGAWNALLGSPGYANGYYVSCMKYRSQGWLYTPCGLSTTTGFGSFEMPYYTCQGSCPGTKMRGGQCKPFMNLVAYRSGQYQGSSGAFKAFPSDACIQYVNCDPNGSARSATDSNYPLATYANILEGDFLRRPGGHALIVVRKISSSQVVVFDSNWLTGDGQEAVGSHTLSFSGSGNYNLGNYRVLKCAYAGSC